MILINFLLMLFLITIADVKANAQTCISLFEEQKIISKLSFEQQETLISLAQHQVEVTSNPILPQSQKNQILQQIESEITNFMRDMDYNTYEIKLFLAEYRALVFKAKERLNPNVDLQIGEVENKQNAIKEAQSKRDKIELIKRKYWELENSRDPFMNQDFKTMTAPLDHALSSIAKVDVLTKEHIDDFKLILEFGGNPFSTHHGAEPLYIAITKDHYKLIELMLDNGIDVITPLLEYQTALTIASGLGYTNTVRVLLNKGANPNILTPRGATALYFACSEGHLEIVKLLIEHKADVNSMRKLSADVRTTELHSAAKYGNLDIVKLLVQSGADTKARNILGQTPLQQALALNHTAVADFLRAHAKSSPLSEKIKNKLIDIKHFIKGERR